MTTYNILRWDPIVSGNNPNSLVPMITIIPDIFFLEFATANNFTLYCKIHNTNVSMYNDSLIKGYVSKSCDVPNCRPNYCSQTNYYVITLDCPWITYPHDEGVVMFLGFKDLNSMNVPPIIESYLCPTTGCAGDDCSPPTIESYRADSANGKNVSFRDEVPSRDTCNSKDLPCVNDQDCREHPPCRHCDKLGTCI
tara:strand:+ start:1980 stop:2564 length:585 start_codon:yes stop_codon:yes gene_type:complete